MTLNKVRRVASKALRRHADLEREERATGPYAGLPACPEYAEADRRLSESYIKIRRIHQIARHHGIIISWPFVIADAHFFYNVGRPDHD